MTWLVARLLLKFPGPLMLTLALAPTGRPVMRTLSAPTVAMAPDTDVVCTPPPPPQAATNAQAIHIKSHFIFIKYLLIDISPLPGCRFIDSLFILNFCVYELRLTQWVPHKIWRRHFAFSQHQVLLFFEFIFLIIACGIFACLANLNHNFRVNLTWIIGCATIQDHGAQILWFEPLSMMKPEDLKIILSF